MSMIITTKLPEHEIIKEDLTTLTSKTMSDMEYDKFYRLNTTNWFVAKKKVGANSYTGKLIFYVPPYELMTHPTLLLRSQIPTKNNPFLVYDGTVVNRQQLGDKFHHLLSKHNPITPETINEIGKTICSSFNVTGIPQHVFYPIPSSGSDVNNMEQWFCGSKNLNEEQYIGYEFTNGATYFLNEVKIISRIGTMETSGKKAPSPKSIRIEGLTTDHEWIILMENHDIENWSFLTPVSFDFHDDIDIECKGFRIVIPEWCPGEEEDMFPGLYKIEFLCTAGKMVRMPILPTLTKDFVYAQHIPGYIDDSFIDSNIKEDPTVNLSPTLIQELLDLIPLVNNTNVTPESIKEIATTIYNEAYQTDLDIAEDQIEKIFERLSKEDYSDIKAEIYEFMAKVDTQNEEINTIQNTLSELNHKLIDIKNNTEFTQLQDKFNKLTENVKLFMKQIDDRFKEQKLIKEKEQQLSSMSLVTSNGILPNKGNNFTIQNTEDISIQFPIDHKEKAITITKLNSGSSVIKTSDNSKKFKFPFMEKNKDGEYPTSSSFTINQSGTVINLIHDGTYWNVIMLNLN